MRYPASEKLEIIRLVEQSHLPARRALQQIGIPRSTFYRWCDLYRTGGPEALDDCSPRPDRVWNRIPDDVRARIWSESFAIINALIFGMVILIAQAFNVGRALRDKALARIVLGKSLLFMILLLLFHVAEESIRAWFKSLPPSTSIQDFGGGTWLGLITYAAIFFVVLISFFAFQEVAGLVGAGALFDLFFTRDWKEVKFVRE
jgi:hypothetical protein